MTSVALATCREFPLLDDEDRLLIPALAALGIEAMPAVWTDPAMEWTSFDAVVLRETWDYADRRADFLDWTRRVEQQSRLFNPADIVEWNTDKHYLRELMAAGVSVVPTRFLEPGDDPDAWLPEGEFTDVVVKPAVSCGSRDTVRYHTGDPLDQAAAHVKRLLGERRSVMVQPYLDDVDTLGETAMLFLDGEFSHAVCKGPLLDRGVEGQKVEGLFVKEQIDPRVPTRLEHEAAAAVMDSIPGGRADVLYARVDLVPGPDGPLLLELELAEPSLFLSHEAGAPTRLAAAIARRVATGR